MTHEPYLYIDEALQCVGNLTIIDPDNGLSPSRRQAIIWTNDGILFIGPIGINFSEFQSNFIHFHSRKYIWIDTVCKTAGGGGGGGEVGGGGGVGGVVVVVGGGGGGGGCALLQWSW